MMGYGGFGGHYGFSLLGAGFGLITHLAFTILVILAIIYLYKNIFRNVNNRSLRGQQDNAALEILRARYARGEIPTEEFQKMKKELE
ncbi:SHOCT domain-containing protein [Pectinatus cerevisiiphilus]|uniref:Putative membrane protein n=1 Tax=Pectinatus cerevisiiphilus TaxID=86956 RepID=A0A4R3KE76_9FIRM|nr:SHOCT domain-containing protein [Pectinatus cerevisiiphilus]TCS81373.1 putative membrane protein [Pectinatus cerevisiiphilus]